MRIFLAIAFLACLSTGSTSAQTSVPSTIKLGHGVNLGNFLEAPAEGKWSGNRILQEDDFVKINQAGFTLIRVPIRWSAHIGDGPGFAIDPTFLSRVDWVVTQAEKNQLQVILDYHNDPELMKQPEKYGDRFIAIWKQIAEHYQSAPDTVIFELLNEPNQKLDAPHWNKLLAQTLTVVRASNPTRAVVIGPVQWNNISALPKLVLPTDDRHLIVTFHYYDPLKFTHQGANWMEGSSAWMGTTWTGSDDEKHAINKAFDQAADWGRLYQRPLYLGEFGAYEKGDIESRVRWTTFVEHAARSRGIPWTYWEYCAGFGVFDPNAKQWRQPLLNALTPKE